MKVKTLIDFLDATTNIRFVRGDYHDRGGVMLVGFPGSLRTTMIQSALHSHSDALVLSDLNVHQWLNIREDFCNGTYSTLGFLDFEKLYQRHNSTAMHIEGIIKGVVCEGYGVGPAGDQRMPTPLARATVVGALTQACLAKKYNEWNDNGFLRRFLWLTIYLENQNEIGDAIQEWEKIDLGDVVKISIKPGSLTIPMKLGKQLEEKVRHMMKEQPGRNGTPYVLLKKIFAVLLWKYSHKQAQTNGKIDPFIYVEKMADEIAPALSKNGARIEL